MIKFYCNKCGIELKVENRRKVKMLISFYGEINLDFCENCFKEVIGDIEYCELIKTFSNLDSILPNCSLKSSTDIVDL